MISDVGRRFVTRCRSERAYHQLNAMDTRMLRDVGLDRTQIAIMSGGAGRHGVRGA
jgi:uncharacterized protein YjiS (DUF1127 family)